MTNNKRRTQIESGIIIGLLTLMASSSVTSIAMMYGFMKDNSSEHISIEKTLVEEKTWTHNVDKYVIIPTEERSKNNTQLIRGHENRIHNLEVEIK